MLQKLRCGRASFGHGGNSRHADTAPLTAVSRGTSWNAPVKGQRLASSKARAATGIVTTPAKAKCPEDHPARRTDELLNGAEVSLFLGAWSDTRAAITELGQRDLPVGTRSALSCSEGLLMALTGTLKGP